MLTDLEELPRDRWGRPLLLMPGSDIRTPFTRASTLSTAIENTFGLEQWKQRQILIGLSRRPELLGKAKNAQGDVKTLNAIIEAAKEEAEMDKAASLGTKIHKLTEYPDRGLPLPKGTSQELMDIVNGYLQAKRGWTVLEIEQFVGCLQIRTAGTFDRVLKAPDGKYYIADIKTGIDATTYAHTAQVQLAVYAHGTQYRFPGDTWDPRSLAQKGVNQERAVLIHVPQDGAKPSLHWVNIDQGWKYAIVAAKVRAWWNSKPTTPILNGSH